MRQRNLSIHFLDLNMSLKAKLLEETNPEICQILWESLPYCTTTFHTMVSGKNIFHIIPNSKLTFKSEVIKQNRMDSPIGTMFMYSPRNMLIKYGEDSEERYFPPVAQIIEEDVKKLIDIGKMTWQISYNNGGLNRLIVEKEENSHLQDTQFQNCKFSLVESSKIFDESLRPIAEELHKAIKDIWISPPQEIEAIYSGKQSSLTNSGSYGQFFSTLIFLEGEVRHQVGLAGIGIVDVVIRMCELDSTSLETIKKILQMSIDDSSKFIGFCGFHQYRTFVDRILSSLEQINREDLIHLLSLLSLYGNKLHLWNLHYFPWKIGSNYQYDPKKVAEITPKKL
jgi:hypothetical protein